MWRRTTSRPLSTATRPGSRRNSSASSASASSQRVWRSSRRRSSSTSRCSSASALAGDALALALQADHGHERAGVGLGGQAEERRARDLARVAAPGRVLGLGRAARGGEELLQRQHAGRVVEGRQRRRELLAGARGAGQGAQGAVDELHPQRRGARERGHRHRRVLDERGEDVRGQMRRRLVVAGALDRARDRHAGLRRAAHGDHALDVLHRVAARPRFGPMGLGEAVAALPRAQALARDAGERREARRRNRLFTFAHPLHPYAMVACRAVTGRVHLVNSSRRTSMRVWQAGLAGGDRPGEGTWI